MRPRILSLAGNSMSRENQGSAALTTTATFDTETKSVKGLVTRVSTFKVVRLWASRKDILRRRITIGRNAPCQRRPPGLTCLGKPIECLERIQIGLCYFRSPAQLMAHRGS